MRVLSLLLFALLHYNSLSAQNTTFITVKAGNKIKDVLATTDVFYYPQFTKGRVVFKDATKGEAALNYSRLLDQMLFIDSKGDTLALADEKT
ncbi:MAG TPA: hypothetical protein VM871_05935, partial [Flavisolibacter sp.]|nr:hypothetical protein [Flavisolibacter sp.]